MGSEMSKLQDYLKQQKIDPRRLLAASHKLEASQPEDRVTRLAKKKAKGGDESAKEAAGKKPTRSGKPLTQPTLDRALHAEKAEKSGALSGAAKTRILRALNSVLTAKKQPEAQLKDLF